MHAPSPDNLVTLYQDIVTSSQFRVVIHDSQETTPDLVDTEMLDNAIRHLAHRLQAMGIEPGDCVLYQGHQSADALVSFWATVLIGGVFAPVDPEWPAYLRHKALDKARPKLIIAEPGMARFWQEAEPELPVIPSCDAMTTSKAEGTLCQWPACSLPANAPAACLFTSGSTGDPKAVVLGHAALAKSAGLAVKTFDWHTGETLVNLAEPHTMSGLRNGFLTAPLAGMCWASTPETARQSIFDLIEFLVQARPHRLVAAPVLLRHINLLGPRLDTRALQSLAALYCTGADLRNEDVQTFYQRHRTPVINYYGLTETVGLCLSQSLSGWRPDDTTLGWAVGCEARIDEEASDAAGTGELLIKQRYPMSGYLRDQAATESRFDGDWLRTGDLVSQQPDGRLQLVGRKDNFIKTASTDRLYPQEIEAVLESHAQVLEAACLGIPDGSGSERVTALVVAAPHAGSPEPLVRALYQYAREHLGARRAPTSIQVVAAMPRTSNGKLQRNKLKDLIDAD